MNKSYKFLITALIYFNFTNTAIANTVCPPLTNTYALCQNGSWHLSIENIPSNWHLIDNHVDGNKCNNEGEIINGLAWQAASYNAPTTQKSVDCGYYIWQYHSTPPLIIGYFDVYSSGYIYDNSAKNTLWQQHQSGYWNCCYGNRGCVNSISCPIRYQPE